MLRHIQVLLALFFLLLGNITFAVASELNILTSFPPSFYLKFEQAFKQQYPTIKLNIRNKKTTAGIRYLKRSVNHDIDLFWASSPDAFEILKSDGLLQNLPNIDFNYPSQLGSYPLRDPELQHFGFALSGYGIMFNQQYLKDYKLKQPNSWQDLSRPEYYSHIALSSPSRSGTTHLMIEMILQYYGWQKGWGIILQIAGNAAAITARSYSVPEGVTLGRFGLGLVIDFLSQKIESDNIQFNYATESQFLPASIAILRTSQNKNEAKLFINFILSKQGQKLLTEKDIARLPIDPGLYQQGLSINPFALDRHESKSHYDSVLSKQRFKLVNSIFDHFITFQLQRLQRVWGNIIFLEKNNNLSQLKKDKLLSIKQKLSQLPINKAQSDLIAEQLQPDSNSGYLEQPIDIYKQQWIGTLLKLELALEQL